MSKKTRLLSEDEPEKVHESFREKYSSATRLSMPATQRKGLGSVALRLPISRSLLVSES
jgi:hypothetical protein